MKTGTTETTAHKKPSRPPFGFALKFNPQTPPPSYKVFRADLPAFGFAWCDTHLTRLMKGGKFPPAQKLSPRKRYWLFSTLQAYEAVVTAGLDWRKWTAANLPLSDVETWIAAKTARKEATAKAAHWPNRAARKGRETACDFSPDGNTEANPNSHEQTNTPFK